MVCHNELIINTIGHLSPARLSEISYKQAATGTQTLPYTRHRSRSAADAQRANCEAPERTGADRHRQPRQRNCEDACQSGATGNYRAERKLRNAPRSSVLKTSFSFSERNSTSIGAWNILCLRVSGILR